MTSVYSKYMAHCFATQEYIIHQILDLKIPIIYPSERNCDTFTTGIKCFFCPDCFEFLFLISAHELESRDIIHCHYS